MIKKVAKAAKSEKNILLIGDELANSPFLMGLYLLAVVKTRDCSIFAKINEIFFCFVEDRTS